MNTCKVKICGIRTVAGAQTALLAGADFLGFNFIESSKRFIDPITAKLIISNLKNTMSIVGVFQNAKVQEVNDISNFVGLDFVQLHGAEDDEYMQKINKKIIKRVSLNENRQVSPYITYYLVDRVVQGQGKLVNPQQAKKIANQSAIFLAGGLTPENVQSVISVVQPFAVDVAGGIETNGKEDMEKIALFINNVKGAVL